MPLVPGLNGDLDALLAGLPPDARAFILRLLRGEVRILNPRELARLIHTLWLAGEGAAEELHLLDGDDARPSLPLSLRMTQG